MAKICFGEFDWPNHRSKQAYVREQFLIAVANHRNELWQELYTLLPLYMPLTQAKALFTSSAELNKLDDFWNALSGKAALESDFPNHRNLSKEEFLREIGEYRESQLTWSNVWSIYRHQATCPSKSLARFARGHEYEKEIRFLVKALRLWAKKRNLDADWCLESAFSTLRMWSASERKPEVFKPDTESIGGPSVVGPQAPDGLPLYLPTALSRKEYLDDLRSKDVPHGTLKRAQAYCSAVEQCYAKAGYPRCKAGEKRKLRLHLEWAVRFQVCGESLENIANSIGEMVAGGIEKSTVLRGVYDLLRLIDLEKRADARRGRRAGSKSKESRTIRQTRRELAR